MLQLRFQGSRQRFLTWGKKATMGKKGTEMETSTGKVEEQFEMSNIVQEGKSGK